MFIRSYLTKLCSDPTHMDFWRYLDNVGKMHVGANPHIESKTIGLYAQLHSRRVYRSDTVAPENEDGEEDCAGKGVE
jgi:hypothetical protein